MASFYTPETAPRDSQQETVESIIAKALSMHVHVQQSYFPLVVQIIDAFTQVKIYFSALDKAKRKAGKPKEIPTATTASSPVPYKYHLQLYAFFNDL